MKLLKKKESLVKKTVIKKAKSDVRDKFQKRSQDVLKKVWKKREERSTTGGKNIFITDGLPEYVVKKGDNAVFIAPLGFSENDGFHKEIRVHFGVGPALDKFICRQAYLKEPCPRCEDQQVGTRKWREEGGTKGNYPKKLSQMFPNDAIIYLVLDMTNEETMEEGWKLWRAPKEKVHAEIIGRTHNKKTQEWIDITHFDEGRIVCFEMAIRQSAEGNFPNYTAFNLIPLDDPIPDKYIQSLAEIIESGESNGGTIEQFLYIPTYDEVAKSHYAGIDSKRAVSKEEEATEDSEAPVKEEEGMTEDQVRETLADMNPIQLKRWAKERGINVPVTGRDTEEIIEDIIEKLTEEEGTEENKPECFGIAAYEKKGCVQCKWLDEGCAEATEKSLEDD